MQEEVKFTEQLKEILSIHYTRSVCMDELTMTFMVVLSEEDNSILQVICVLIFTFRIPLVNY